MLSPREKKLLRKAFPYKYCGAGYFRAVNKDKGPAYKIVHGDEAVLLAVELLLVELSLKDPDNSPCNE